MKKSTSTLQRDLVYLAALHQEWPHLGWLREHEFHPERRWRFDFAAPCARVALEIEGGVWTRGRHSRGAGMIGDMRKYNAATAKGWKIIRCTPQMFEDEFPAVVDWLSGAMGEFADI